MWWMHYGRCVKSENELIKPLISNYSNRRRLIKLIEQSSLAEQAINLHNW